MSGEDDGLQMEVVTKEQKPVVGLVSVPQPDHNSSSSNLQAAGQDDITLNSISSNLHVDHDDITPKSSSSSLQVDQDDTTTVPDSGREDGSNTSESNVQIGPDRISMLTDNSNGVELVTEAASTWSAVCFLVTSSFTGIHLAHAISGDSVYTQYYAFMLLPMAGTALACSFALKPRRIDFAYKTFLYIQYGLSTVASELFNVLGLGSVFFSSLRCVVWVITFLIAKRLRDKIADLPNSDLSEYISIGVLKGGIVVGLSQLIFIVFGSVRCEAEAIVEEPGRRMENFKACMCMGSVFVMCCEANEKEMETFEACMDRESGSNGTAIELLVYLSLKRCLRNLETSEAIAWDFSSVSNLTHSSINDLSTEEFYEWKECERSLFR